MDGLKEQGDRCQEGREREKKNNNKNKRKVQASTGAASGTRGWLILQMHAPSRLDESMKDKSMKVKSRACANVCFDYVCVCVVDFSAASAPWWCLSVAKGAPALAPNQPRSCVHSALPLAAGKLVPAICHTTPHTPVSCVLLFMPLRKVCVYHGVYSMCVSVEKWLEWIWIYTLTGRSQMF